MPIAGLDDAFQSRLFGGQGVKIRIRFGIGGIDCIKAGQRVLDVRQGLLDIAADGFGRIQLRLLRQVANVDAGLGAGLTVELGIDPRHDAQQGGFARAVQAQHANLGTGEKGQGNVPEDLAFGGHDLAHAVHGINVLSHFGMRK